MTIIDNQRYFTNLPRDYYLSEERYRSELDVIYAAQWLYIAHISEVPEAGDYVVRELPGLGESILIVRDEGGVLHAHYNVCRHRGFSLCSPGAGQLKRISCPYHKWTYDLNGRLLGSPSMRDGEIFDYKDFGLTPVRMEVWHGFVFINLSGAAASLSPQLDATAPEMLPLRTERLRVAHHETYDIEANWKILMENYLECYHCTSVHPEFCVPMDIQVIFEDQVALEPTSVVKAWIPLKQGMESLTMDGRKVCRVPLGDFSDGLGVPDGFGAGFMTQPAVNGFFFQSDFGIAHRVEPLSPTRCRLHNWWFVHEDAVEGRDYDRAQLIQLWDTVNRQDAVIIERQQVGVSSRGFRQGPLSAAREPGLLGGLTMYLQMMGEGD
jgi:Rieske 2Fe-2S family protein